MTLSLSTMIFIGTACDGNDKDSSTTHTCEYNQEIVLDAYKANEETCMTKAKYYYSCSCGEKGTETFEYGEVAPHNYGEWMQTTAPTCTTAGEETRYCAYNNEHIETRVVNAHEHSLGTWEQTKAPTCEQDGEETRNCLYDCAYKETRAIARGSHNYGEWIQTTAPTCTTAGEETRYCSYNKEHIETRVVNAHEHSMGTWEQTKAPTCEQEGEETRNCLYDCAYKETRAIARASHNYGEWIQTTAPTCTTAGEETRYCSYNSKHIETKQIDNIGHSYGEWVTVRAPSCIQTGLKEKVCDCGFKQQEELPILSHEYSSEWKSNVESHWQECRFNCGTKTQGVSHQIEDKNICEVCSYIYHTEDLAYSLSEDKEYYIVTGIGYANTPYISIPEMVNNKPVKAIAENAFKNNKTITHLIMPDDFEIIGTQAFYGCTALKNISIGENLTKIGKQAFYNTAYYNEKSNWESNVLYIGNCLITARTITLGTVITKANCYLIADNAFDGCETIIGLETNSALKYVGDDALTGLTGLLSATIPYCPNSTLSKTLENLTITKGEIGEAAFKGYTALKSFICLDEVVSIGAGTLQGCTALENLVLPFVGASLTANEGYNEVFGYIFGYVQSYSAVNGAIAQYFPLNSNRYYYYITNNIKNVEITSETDIYKYAFYGCNSLVDITFSNSIKTIDEFAFSGCGALKNVYFKGSIQDWCNISFNWNSANPLNYAANLYIEGELVTDVYIPEGITGINNGIFQGYTRLENITLPASLTSVGVAAFEGCLGLKNIYYAGNITKWLSISWNSRNNPLQYVDNFYIKDILVKDIVVSNEIEKINAYAFYKYKKLSSVSLDSSVTMIEEYAFSGCSNLLEIIIPDSVVSIGERAFSECINLRNVQLGKGLKYINGYSTFSGCTSLTRIFIPKSVESIGYACFSECPQLMIFVEQSTKPTSWSTGWNSDNYYVVWNCKNEFVHFDGMDFVVTNEDKLVLLQYTGMETTLTIPENINDMQIKEIGENAFWGCTSLTKIIIPLGMETIGNGAFINCTSLKEVILPASVLFIGKDSFKGCSNLEKVTLPFIGASATACNGYDQVLGYIFGYTTSYSSSYSGATYQYRDSKNNTYYHYFIPETLKTIKLLNTVNKIGAGAFKGCNSIEEIYIDSLDTWFNIVFEDEYSNPLYYADKLYANNQLIETLEVPQSVERINSYAFYGYSRLQKIKTSETLVSIGKQAFYNCVLLDTIIIEESVNEIQTLAFRTYFSYLPTVYYKGTSSKWDEINIDSSNDMLISAKRYYYSESEPVLNANGTAYDGNYWRYGDNGEIVIWEYKKEN